MAENQPAATPPVHVGTCSWSDRELLSSGWYPADAKTPEKRLAFYSLRFSTVEIDSTFYAIPDVERIYRWIASTRPNFMFNVKCFGLFTFHAVSASSLPVWARSEVKSREPRLTFKEIPREIRLQLWKQFHDAVMPLSRTGHMGYMLFQLPPWLTYSTRMLDYINRLSDLCNGIRVAFEVRNNSWLKPSNAPSFLRALKSHDIACVCADEPDVGWTVKPQMHDTASWGQVIRLHGRNAATWMKKDASVTERFRYLYSQDELSTLRHFISRVKTRKELFVMFNNCYSDFAARNASALAEMLGLNREPHQEELEL